MPGNDVTNFYDQYFRCQGQREQDLECPWRWFNPFYIDFRQTSVSEFDLRIQPLLLSYIGIKLETFDVAWWLQTVFFLC